MHDHAHPHGPGHASGPVAIAAAPQARRRAWRRRLGAMLALTGTYMVAEVIGGLYTGSLALLADAGHMLADVGALALSLFAFWLATRPAPAARTYGWYRIEILAALANGATLVAVAFFVFFEAVERLREPAPVLGAEMMAIAAGGLLVNAVGLAVLHGGRHESLNLRGAWLHLLSDALGSVGALLAGLLVWTRGWLLADAIAGMLIGLLVVRASWSLLREAVAVLLEGAPGHIDVDDVRGTLRRAEGVASVHDLHVWTITSGWVALSCHVRKEADVATAPLLASLGALLRERFGIEHSTIQIEPQEFDASCAGDPDG